MKRKLKLMMMALAVGLSMTACGQNNTKESKAPVVEEVAVAEGGSLIVKVNPEIKVSYDKDGKVESLEAQNEDGKEIVAQLKDYEGKDTSLVVKALVKVLGEKGYFVEEVEGENKEIVIEIEEGSKIPTDDFLDDIVKSVTAFINSGDYEADIYEDDDKDKGAKASKPARKIGVRPTKGASSKIGSNPADTNYDDSAYGDDTKANTATIPVNNSASNNDDSAYDDSAYGQSNANYNSNTSSNTNDDSNYDDSNYGETYQAPVSQPAYQAPAQSYDDSGYDDSGYDSSNDSYDDSGYDDSGYDD